MNIATPMKPDRDKPAARSRLTLLALVLLCGLPFVGAWLLMIFPELRPDGHSEHGTLYEPVAPLAARQFVDLKGEALGLAALEGKWTLAWIGTRPCDARCDVPLGTLQRIRRALSEDANQAQVVGILTEPPSDPGWRARMENDRLTRIIAGPAEAVSALVTQMRGAAGDGAAPAYFLIDPRGYLVLHYAADVDYKDVLADLRHLIRYVSLR